MGTNGGIGKYFVIFYGTATLSGGLVSKQKHIWFKSFEADNKAIANGFDCLWSYFAKRRFEPGPSRNKAAVYAKDKHPFAIYRNRIMENSIGRWLAKNSG
eukprot:136293_1